MSSEIVKTGQNTGAGCYFCTYCGSEVTVTDADKMPSCPNCTNTDFVEGPQY